MIDSTFFSDSSHQNPSYMPYTSQAFTASPITVGSYYLSQGLVDKINWYSEWKSDGSLSVDKISDDGKETAKVYGNGFFFGSSPSFPDVGDMKISKLHEGLFRIHTYHTSALLFTLFRRLPIHPRRRSKLCGSTNGGYIHFLPH